MALPQGADNGEYAGAIVREMVDGFIGLKEALYPDALMKQLRRIQRGFAGPFSSGFCQLYYRAYSN